MKYILFFSLLLIALQGESFTTLQVDTPRTHKTMQDDVYSELPKNSPTKVKRDYKPKTKTIIIAAIVTNMTIVFIPVFGFLLSRIH